MDVKEVLLELGLSVGEIKVYLALLKLGSVPVSKIKEETNLHRTTIYDFIEKLLNKGLINYVVKNNVKFFNASHPSKLSDFLKEKHDKLSQIMPELEGMTKLHKEEVEVEVYKGPEGLKTVLLDCVRTGEEALGIGIDDGLYKKYLPVFMEQYQRLLKENNVYERVLAKPNMGYRLDSSNTTYKFVSEDFFSPTSMFIFGNNVQLVLWEPSLTTIKIKNKFFADAFRKHFEALWNQESMVFSGEEEIKYVFEGIINSLNKDQEYVAFGVSHESEKWFDYFDGFCSDLDKKKVKSRVIVDERAKKFISFKNKYKNMDIRTLSKEYMSPAEVDVYGEHVAIILWSEIPQAFVIKNKKIAESFMQYFKLMWGIAKD